MYGPRSLPTTLPKTTPTSRLCVNLCGRWFVETTHNIMRIGKPPLGDLLMLESTRFRRQHDSQHHRYQLDMRNEDWASPD